MPDPAEPLIGQLDGANVPVPADRDGPAQVAGTMMDSTTQAMAEAVVNLQHSPVSAFESAPVQEAIGTLNAVNLARINFSAARSEARQRQSQEAGVTSYDGDDRICAICQTRFVGRERVIRLRCRHMFHAQCWLDLAISRPRQEEGTAPTELSCPNCRGPGDVIASWPFIPASHGLPTGVANDLVPNFPGAVFPPPAPEQVEQEPVTVPLLPRSPQVHDMTVSDGDGIDEVFEMDDNPLRPSTPRSGANISSSTYGTPFSRVSGHRPSWLTFPCNPVEGTVLDDATLGSLTRSPASAAIPLSFARNGTRVYHANTRLKDGRPALLVDPGTRTNLAGDMTMRHAARTVYDKTGQKATSSKREFPMSVAGVGQGSQDATHDCKLPVCMLSTDGKRVEATYTAPTVGQSDLPALLGLQSLVDNRALLDFDTMQLHFRGPGESQMNLPPGSESYQLEEAPSGHLMLPCCEYRGQPTVNSSSSLLRGEDMSLMTQSPSTSSTYSKPSPRLMRKRDMSPVSASRVGTSE